MIRNRQSYDRRGEGTRSEKRILGIWFFAQLEEQQWSPVMTEFTIYLGIRIGSYRLSISRTGIEWHDNNEPAKEWRVFQ